MGINKVEFAGEVLIDLTNDTTTAETTLAGYTGHSADGEPFSGNVDLSVYATTAYVDEQVATRAIRNLYNAVLSTNWSGSTAPYTQTIAISGITTDDTPHITPIYGDNTENEMQAWSLVTRATTANGSITFYCYGDKPTISLNLQIEVIK